MKRKVLRGFLVVALRVVLPILFFAFAQTSLVKAKVEPIKVGGPFPLTGPYAGDGKTMKEAILLAIEEINAKGGLLGRPLELVMYDVGDMLPEKLSAAGEYLVSKKGCDAIIVGWCGMGPDIPAFGRYDVPYIHGNSSEFCVEQVSKNLGKYWNIFQVYDMEKNYVKDVFSELEQLGYQFPNKKVAIIGGDVEWDLKICEALRELARSEGWKVVIDEKVPYGTREWRPILVKIRKQKPAVIFYSNLDPSDLVSFLNQFLQNPTKSLLDLGYGFSVEGYLRLAGKNAEGTLGYPKQGIPIFASEEGRAFMKRYEKRWGHKPALAISAGSYDSVYIWAAAARRVGNVKDYRAVCNAILNYPYRGICGVYKFNPKTHHAPLATNYLQVQNGKFKLLFLNGKKVGEFKLPPWVK